MRVLIADADEVFLEILKNYLCDNGHEAKGASDGLGCVTLLRDFEPEIVVLERELLWGGSDGVMAYMRNDPILSRTPVILTTDNISLEELGAMTKPRLVGWLRKPFRLNDLLRQITSIGSEVRSANLGVGVT